MTFNVLDAGDSMLVHVRTPAGNNILFNTASGDTRHQAQWLTKPYLMSQGIRNLDTIVLLSTYKKDVSGLPTLMSNFRIGHIFYPDVMHPHIAFIHNNDLMRRIICMPAHGGTSIQGWKDVTLRVIMGPQCRYIQTLAHSVLVVQLCYETYRILLCTCINEEIVRRLMNSEHSLRSTVVVLPASTVYDSALGKRFFTAVSPHVVVYFGNKNHVHMTSTKPHAIPFIYATADHGALRMTLDAKNGLCQLRSHDTIVDTALKLAGAEKEYGSNNR